ncbi:MAG: SPOR domain-containing protein [Flavobacteriales bacterium]
MRFLPTFLLLLLAIGLRAQDDPRVFRPSTATADTPRTAGEVTIHQSERINELMTDYATHKQPLKGFRVQVFLGDRTQAEETRRTFLVKHPDIPAYLSYLAPNFRVRVGDLRDRLEAERMREQLKGEFPGLYVVPDDIELPRLP